MRPGPVLAVLLCALATSACSMLMPILEVGTRPLDAKGTFEETQAAYSSDIRYGLYEDALRYVEPDHQARFRAELPRYRDLRFSEVRTESTEIDDALEHATAVVVYRGYSLSSPYEREIRITQHWRREGNGSVWYVTPDFEGLLSPVDVSGTTPPAAVSAD